MRRAVWLTLLIVFGQGAPCAAWGFVAHKLILERAIALLPPELQPFFQRHRAELLLRVTDPDLWREAGWEDDPNHFLNFGVREYGPYPFDALPREYGAAIEKFGVETLRRNGLLPWRVAEEFGNLRRAFAGREGGRSSGPDTGAVVLFAAVAAHYVQDAFQPLHATRNYDGQDTVNRGIHARFERDLFARMESRISVTVVPGFRVMTSPRDAVFEALLASHRAVDGLLAADRAALGGRRSYDDQYFDRFFMQVRPMLEERLSSATAATAGLIIGAWEQAGRPSL